MEAFNPNETALVVIDCQNDFCHPDGALYSEASEAAIEPINDLIGRARDADVKVLFTRDAHEPDQFEGNHYHDEFARWGEHALSGSWGAEIHDDVDTEGGKTVIRKGTYDAFEKTALDNVLDYHDIKDLLICGTLANVCVLHTASSAALHDYRPVVVEDALGYIEESDKAYATDHIDFLFGEVASSDEVTFA